MYITQRCSAAQIDRLLSNKLGHEGVRARDARAVIEAAFPDASGRGRRA